MDLARRAEANGAGEILITSIDRDGTLSGYDVDLVERISSAVRVPVIASGGAGTYEDMAQAIAAGASAVAAAAMFHFTEQTPLEAKRYLADDQTIKVAQGVSGLVVDKGSVLNLVPYILQGLKQALQDIGVRSITELHESLVSDRLLFERAQPTS